MYLFDTAVVRKCLFDFLGAGMPDENGNRTTLSVELMRKPKCPSRQVSVYMTEKTKGLADGEGPRYVLQFFDSISNKTSFVRETKQFGWQGMLEVREILSEVQKDLYQEHMEKDSQKDET